MRVSWEYIAEYALQKLHEYVVLIAFTLGNRSWGDRENCVEAKSQGPDEIREN